MSPKPILPILDRAKEMLDYDPETGVFTWKKAHKTRTRLIGRVAGAMLNGYRVISLGRSNVYAHRLAWAWVHGEEPPVEVDHINRDRLDNRIDNLRNGDKGINQSNMPISKRNKSGVIGVCFDKARPAWLANLKGKSIYIGADFFEAVCARKSAENQFWSAV